MHTGPRQDPAPDAQPQTVTCPPAGGHTPLTTAQICGIREHEINKSERQKYRYCFFG